MLDPSPTDELIANMITSRSALLDRMFDPRRDIDVECGYPTTITTEQYRRMYERTVGRRVVSVYPEETWKMLPEITEDPDPGVETDFEKTWADVERQHHILHYMQRVDELSGVGHYGVLLFGLNDGKRLSEPVSGFGDAGATGTPKDHQIIYVRVLDESLAKIASWEQDPTNPRYGEPTAYTITLADPRIQPGGVAVSPPDTIETRVHWTRIVHVADNRTTSEVFGTPRQGPVWNRLLDLRKILGGSGEMYWKGGFPGISLETHPNLENVEVDVDSTRKAMCDYQNGMQRYMLLSGMTARSMAPQIADPSASFEVQIKAICIIIGVPYRVFMGSEEGVLAGKQDSNAWDGRLSNRQTRYVTPMIVDSVLQRLVDYGVLAPPKNFMGWEVTWPNARVPSESESADVAVKQTDALAKYVGGGVDALIPPLDFLTIFLGVKKDRAEAILRAAIEHIEDIEDDDEITPGRLPTPEEPLGGVGMVPSAAGNAPESAVDETAAE